MKNIQLSSCQTTGDVNRKLVLKALVSLEDCSLMKIGSRVQTLLAIKFKAGNSFPTLKKHDKYIYYAFYNTSIYSIVS